MKYKLICSDWDDTLISSNGEYSEENLRAIHRYIDKGGKFCVVTGRMTSGILPQIRRMELHGEVLSFQGAVCVDIDSGNVISEVTIANADAVEIGRYIESKGYMYHTYEKDFFITEVITEYTKIYGRISHAEYRCSHGKLSDYMLNKHLNPPKILIIAEEDKVPCIIKEMRQKFGDRFLINTSKPWIVEIVPIAVSKGVAVSSLAKKYNIKQEEIICIGDSDNDVTMLDYAGLGVAVGNGSEVAFAHADVIAPSNEDSGVAWTIEKYGFLE